MQLFATTPDDARPAILIVALVGSALGVLVAGLLHTPILLAACKLTGVAGVRAGRALATALLADAVFYGFLAFMALGVYVGTLEDRQVRTSFPFVYTPINFIYLFVAGVLGHAALFSACLPERGQPSLGFSRSTAVAIVYLGLSALLATFLFVIGTILRSMLVR